MNFFYKGKKIESYKIEGKCKAIKYYLLIAYSSEDSPFPTINDIIITNINNNKIIKVFDEIGEGNYRLEWKFKKKINKIKYDLKYLDRNMANIIHYAAMYHNIDFFNQLINLEKFLDKKIYELINIQDKNGNTPLHYIQKDSIVTNLLLNNGANKYIKNNDNKIPYEINLIKSLEPLNITNEIECIDGILIEEIEDKDNLIKIEKNIFKIDNLYKHIEYQALNGKNYLEFNDPFRNKLNSNNIKQILLKTRIMNNNVIIDYRGKIDFRKFSFYSEINNLCGLPIYNFFISWNNFKILLWNSICKDVNILYIANNIWELNIKKNPFKYTLKEVKDIFYKKLPHIDIFEY